MKTLYGAGPDLAPGWYADPTDAGYQWYFDGSGWTARFATPLTPATNVDRPNHALHAILTLQTFWMWGGWAWVWLITTVLGPRKN